MQEKAVGGLWLGPGAFPAAGLAADGSVVGLPTSSVSEVHLG